VPQTDSGGGLAGERPKVPLRGLGIEVRVEGESTVLALEGELDIASSPDLTDAVSKLAAEEVDRLVIDMTAVEFIDSTGIRALIETYQAWGKDQDRFQILPSPAPAVTRVLALTGIEAQLPFAEAAEPEPGSPSGTG
jgi:anti-sigma B factor antagonist